MSKEQIYAEEVTRRRLGIDNLNAGLVDINAALEQLNDLDETYKVEQEKFADELNTVYVELRHYLGNDPVVYSTSESTRYPYFNGDDDDDCNPYYRISSVTAGLTDGLSPEESTIDRVGGTGVGRFQEYPNEGDLRSAALASLQAYPNRTFENNPTGGTCVGGTGSNETQCTINGGDWEPEYEGNTAVHLLINDLNPWLSSVTQLKSDLNNALVDATSANATLQDVINQINTVLSGLPSAPTYPNQTPSPSTSLQNAINTLISYIQTDMVSDIDVREPELQAYADEFEAKYFSIIGLRIHQINGSFTKVQSLKDQKITSLNLIEDHIKSIDNINILRVNES